MGKNILVMLLFTNNEKAAIAHVAVSMQGVDGKSDPKEYVLNLLVIKEFGITNSNIESAKGMELIDAMAVLKLMSNDKKRCVSSILGSIILVDGDIDDKEVSLWRLISTICNFPTMRLMDAPDILKEYI